jgi:nitrogen fixation protein NifM
MSTAYLALKLAQQLFKKAPSALDAAERQRVDQLVVKQHALERRILATPEAAAVVIPEISEAKQLEQIRQRYPNEEEFLQDLQQHDLDLATLTAALREELRIELVLERVASLATVATATDAEIFYHLNPAKFTRPETRGVSHILITFNDPAEREAAWHLLEQLKHTIHSDQEFASAALQHSHCPSAMEGGKIGTAKPGMLYPELDAVLFTLALNEMAGPIATEIGIHLIRCTQITPSQTLSFAEVRGKIIEHLTAKRQDNARRQWILSLS